MLMTNLNHRDFARKSRSLPILFSNEALHETVQKRFVSYTAPVARCQRNALIPGRLGLLQAAVGYPLLLLLLQVDE